MSGFFLDQEQHTNIGIYNKNFELWQKQYYQLHHQHRNNDISDKTQNYSDRSGLSVMRTGSGSGNDSINCQDCGNQAKKDCVHMRCRSCCKSRGFQCNTHIKSTWVPAAKRRERQQQMTTLQQEVQPKRHRENYPGGGGDGGGSSALATTSGFELGHFPAEVNSEAVFRCVRMSSMDDADEHLAYQTAVNIRGHVFKGILYGQGPENRYPNLGGSGESSFQPLNLITSTTTVATSSNLNVNMVDPSVYPTPLNAFMAGTQFFPPPRH